MVQFRRVVFLLAAAFLLSPSGVVFSAPGEGEASPWSGSVPEDLFRPRRGESPRYPRDMVIGELGAGEAPAEAYGFGRDLLEALVSGSPAAPVFAGVRDSVKEDLFTKLQPINVQQYRIGGGREESDGSISFLVRFLGREQGISGELYLRAEGERWLLDDLILEDPVDLQREREQYRYDFPPYERFY
ncbi:hypothetical protein AGMMS49928_16310 [Spirochaetia bacterium]|nr:hypothetical protein AGMMS49928_16310 [Spirochaetia bacterium]